jgi:hypothetical protein
MYNLNIELILNLIAAIRDVFFIWPKLNSDDL